MNMLKLVLVFVLGSALAVPLVESDDGRIIGGSDAPVGQYPYQISLKLHNSHNCGGSIISPYWILTAAHCVYGLSAADLQVVVGTNYLNSGGVRHMVSRVIMHEGYDKPKIVNDVAVLQLSTPIQYNSAAQPITLATSTTPSGLSCKFSGWGRITYPQENVPNSLQHIYLTSITVGQCQQSLPGHVVSASNVCTREPSGRGICLGDSGGPLVCGDVQHGIASWVIPCGKGNPDVFASVAYYRDWIRSKTGV